MLTPTETVVSPTERPQQQIWQLTSLQAMEWVFFVLAFMFLVARFWVRFSLRQYQAWISDLLLVIALVCTIGNIMCDTLIYKVDGLLEYKHVTQYLGKVSDRHPLGMENLPKHDDLTDLGSPVMADSFFDQVLLRCRPLLPQIQPAHELCHHGTGDGAKNANLSRIHRNVSCARVSDGRLFRFVLVRQRRVY